MVLKRSRGYEDIDGQTASATVQNDNSRNEPVPPQEIEMASVSVVPDGIVIFNNSFELNLIMRMISRYFYCNTSSKRFRFWLVSSKTILMDWFVLDG